MGHKDIGAAGQVPLKLVIVLEGGVLRDVISESGPVSVAVIDYDTDVDFPNVIEVPQGNGKFAGAYGSIFPAELNPARTAELYAAVEQGPGEYLGVMDKGFFTGKIVGVDDVYVTQKVSRDGATVKHATARLSETVSAGDIVDIKYVEGKGIVSGLERASIER